MFRTAIADSLADALKADSTKPLTGTEVRTIAEKAVDRKWETIQKYFTTTEKPDVLKVKQDLEKRLAAIAKETELQKGKFSIRDAVDQYLTGVLDEKATSSG